MRTNFLMFFMFSLFSDYTIIELKHYYKGYGVIFNKDSKALYEYKVLSDTFFTPEFNNIKIAEEILSNDYYNYLHEISIKTGFYNSLDVKYKRKKRVIKKYYNFNRQCKLPIFSTALNYTFLSN